MVLMHVFLQALRQTSEIHTVVVKMSVHNIHEICRWQQIDEVSPGVFFVCFFILSIFNFNIFIMSRKGLVHPILRLFYNQWKRSHIWSSSVKEHDCDIDSEIGFVGKEPKS